MRKSTVQSALGGQNTSEIVSSSSSVVSTPASTGSSASASSSTSPQTPASSSSSSKSSSTSTTTSSSSTPAPSTPTTVTIKGTEYYTNSSFLDLDGLGLTDSDVVNLKHFTELATLYISDNNITNFSFVSNMKNLETLQANNNKITDISALKNCTNLSWISIVGENNVINDLMPLHTCKKIKFLQLNDVTVTDTKTFEASLYGLNMQTDGELSMQSYRETGLMYDSLDAVKACKAKISGGNLKHFMHIIMNPIRVGN